MSDINITVNDEIVNIDVLDTPVLVEVSNAPGPAGAGVAVGGTTGQVLAKASNTNYDTVWVNPSSGGVPYIGATGNVDLGTHTILAQNATIASSGSVDTATITHSSGSGIALNITKGGNGEGLYVNKTGGSGNAATILGTLNATTIVKSGGTSSQFLKADGSVDATAYVPTTRIITINGVSYDLSADRTWTIAAGISGSGASGQVTYWSGASAVSGSTTFLWNAASNLLRINGGIGVNRDPTGGRALDVTGGGIRLTGSTNGSFEINGSNSSFNIGTVGGIAGINISDTNNAIINMTGNSYTYRILVNASLLRIRDANAGDVDRFAIHSTGNIGIGFGSTDPAVRLGVSGDTLLRGSGNTNTTTALTVQDSAGVDMLIMRNDGVLRIVKRYINTSQDQNVGFGASNDGSVYNAAGLGHLFSTANRTSAGVNYAFFGGNITNTSGAFYHLRTTGVPNFAPTSGTGTFFIASLEATINQTGGANGITRGLYVNPTLTSAADFRAIETTAGNVLFGSNFFWDNANSRLGIGTNAPESGKIIDVVFDEPTLGGRGIRIRNTNTTGFSELIFDNNRTPTGSGRFVFGLGGETSGAPDTAYFFLRLNSSLLFGTNNTERARFHGNGNFSINSTSDLGVRFGVLGDTLLRGSGATSATTALTVQNSDGNNMYRFLNNGEFLVGSSGAVNIRPGDGVGGGTVISGFGLQLNFGFSNTAGYGLVTRSINSAERTNTSGEAGILDMFHGFAPTSGTGTFMMLKLRGTINQTGGANGITRGLYVNPTLTAAADFRAIETTNGKIVFGNLPTSSAGLPSGALWNNGGVINIV